MRLVDDKLGMSTARLSVLSVLVFKGPSSLSQLASIEQVSKPTMTNLVKALEQDGFVRCRPDRSDKRMVVASPTAKGKRLLEKGQQARVTNLAEMIDDLSDSEVACLDTASTIVEKILSSGK